MKVHRASPLFTKILGSFQLFLGPKLTDQLPAYCAFPYSLVPFSWGERRGKNCLAAVESFVQDYLFALVFDDLVV